MGWLFTQGQSRRGLVKHLLTGFSEGTDVMDHKTTVYGRRLWVAAHHKETGTKMVILFLLANDVGRGWGYKDITEGKGPCYYDCPLSLLEITGDEGKGKGSMAWRERVRSYHARKKRVFTKGVKVFLYGKVYTVVGPIKKSYLVRSYPGGKLYRAKTADMVLYSEQKNELQTKEGVKCILQY